MADSLDIVERLLVFIPYLSIQTLTLLNPFYRHQPNRLHVPSQLVPWEKSDRTLSSLESATSQQAVEV